MYPMDDSTSPALAFAPSPSLPPVMLRPYQQECVQRVLVAYEHDRHGEELLVLPTAAGKTVIFSQVIAQLSGRYGVHAVIIAHYDGLCTHAAGEGPPCDD